VILEPTGANFGKMPILPSFLAVLRDLTKQAGTVLIFDEVVTGFRVSPGGVQQVVGITPDMTTLAKILSAGCRVGRSSGGRTSWIGWTSRPARRRNGEGRASGHVQCQPGVGCGGDRGAGDPGVDGCLRSANAFGDELRAKLNEVLEDEGVKWPRMGRIPAFISIRTRKGPTSCPAHSMRSRSFRR